MRAFIIRPFGEKEGRNFDEVEELLIGPVLDELKIQGRTTGEVIEQGNIRADMFELLLTADLVIADVSIHNANVFYELGVRHSLRDKRTVLIRAGDTKPPFDLQTDRYFRYDIDDPAASIKKLGAVISDTISANKTDSPVFQLLPALKAQDASKMQAVPVGFREELEEATAAESKADVDRLSLEAQGFPWQDEALILVGEAQQKAGDFEGAKKTLEAVLEYYPDHRRANSILATVHQNLGDLTASNHAIRRVLDAPDLPAAEHAELQSLMGSNAKVQWVAAWSGIEDAEARRVVALEAANLEISYDAYRRGFDADVNHFYSGLNALAMLTIQVELAEEMPGVWSGLFDSKKEAEVQLSKRAKQATKLANAVEICIDAHVARAELDGVDPGWAIISRAQLKCLTSTKSSVVGVAYRRALAHPSYFDLESETRQLKIYEELGLRPKATAAAFEVITEAGRSSASHDQADPSPAPDHTVVFTGHMLDAPDRETPRFPAEAESAARASIKAALEREIERNGPIELAIAGGASGGDILFHEVCAELDIASELFLAVPPETFIPASVSPAGPDWVDRFNDLISQERQTRILGDSLKLPAWLEKRPDYNIWRRNNLWIMMHALASGARRVTLISLWDREEGDGLGGTQDMVRLATERSAKCVNLDPKEVFDSAV